MISSARLRRGRGACSDATPASGFSGGWLPDVWAADAWATDDWPTDAWAAASWTVGASGAAITGVDSASTVPGCCGSAPRPDSPTAWSPSTSKCRGWMA